MHFQNWRRAATGLGAAVLLAAAPLQATTVDGIVTLAKGKGRGMSDASDAIVSLTALDPAPRDKGRAGKPSAPPATAQMSSVNKTFQPGVLVISAGVTVEFPNRDSIYHNAFSPATGNSSGFDLGLYRSFKNEKNSATHTFETPGIYDIFCNIHERMHGVIFVVDTPYHAQTETDGRFQIDGVAPGRYRLTVQHRRATAAANTELQISGNSVTKNVTLSISEGRRIDHRRKDGSQYPAGSLY